MVLYILLFKLSFCVLLYTGVGEQEWEVQPMSSKDKSNQSSIPTTNSNLHIEGSSNNNISRLGSRLASIREKGLSRSIHELPFTGGRTYPVSTLFTSESSGNMDILSNDNNYNTSLYNLSSNDYLGLVHHEGVIDAGRWAIEAYGSGSGGSRLMGGAIPLHSGLESQLATLVGYPTVLLVGSGYLANYGLLTALLDSSTYVLFDKLNHASLMDGVLHSGCAWASYPHLNYQALEEKLIKVSSPSISGASKKYEDIYILTDSVFSMDGDNVDLVRLQRLADTYGAKLIIDESHAMGVRGINSRSGAGLAVEHGGEDCDASPKVSPYIVLGTFSKAYASYGGFIACDAEVREFLINTMRTFIFSTSLPPSVLSTTSAAIEITSGVSNTEMPSSPLRTQCSDNMGHSLIGNALKFHNMLIERGLSIESDLLDSNIAGTKRKPSLQPFSSQIIPIMIYDNTRAVKLSEYLWDHGISARAVRYPTVPKSDARVRLSLTLGFNHEDLSYIADRITDGIAVINNE